MEEADSSEEPSGRIGLVRVGFVVETAAELFEALECFLLESADSVVVSPKPDDVPDPNCFQLEGSELMPIHDIAEYFSPLGRDTEDISRVSDPDFFSFSVFGVHR